jgi:hypothetical protein
MLRNAHSRPVATYCALALCGALAFSACASKYAQVPARLELRPYGRVALLVFSSEDESGGLGRLATQRFAEAVLRSQPGFELLELGAPDPALRDLAASGNATALARALGDHQDVPAVFVGHLKVSGIRGRGRIGPPGDLSLRASASAELTVRLLSSRTGGTLWRSSSAASGVVGRVAFAGRLPSVAVRDPDEAYAEVVSTLVMEASQDLRPTRVKQ